MTQLRPYQLDILERARGHFQQGARSVLLTMFCGLGKTKTAAHAVHSHLRLGGKGVVFVVPRRELAVQARHVLSDDPRIHVTTIQALLVAKTIPEATLVVLDEARHTLSDEWSKVRDLFPDALFLGLDATPERGDGRGLGAMFDAIAPGPSIREAIAGGYLVPPEVLRPDRALGPGELAQDPVAAYLAHGRGTKAIAFFPSVALAKEAAAEFVTRGVRAAAVWGDMPTRERDEALAGLERGDLDVLTNQYLLGEGVDIVSVETVILARGFGSAGAYLQAAGRALRPSPGKTRALILDLRGVSHAHGEVDEERTYHLDGKAIRRAGEDLNIRFCSVCGSQVKLPPCPECGHNGALKARKPRVLGLPLARFAHLRAEDDDSKARRLSRWLSHAHAKGYREGQAFHRYRGVFGSMPPRHVIQRARELLAG